MLNDPGLTQPANVSLQPKNLNSRRLVFSAPVFFGMSRNARPKKLE